MRRRSKVRKKRRKKKKKVRKRKSLWRRLIIRSRIELVIPRSNSSNSEIKDGPSNKKKKLSLRLQFNKVLHSKRN